MPQCLCFWSGGMRSASCAPQRRSLKVSQDQLSVLAASQGGVLPAQAPPTIATRRNATPQIWDYQWSKDSAQLSKSFWYFDESLGMAKKQTEYCR